MKRATEEENSSGKSQQGKSNYLSRHLILSLNSAPLLVLAMDQAHVALVHSFSLELFKDSLHGNHPVHQGIPTTSKTMMNKEQPATKQRDFVRKENKGNSSVMSGRRGQTYSFLKEDELSQTCKKAPVRT